MFALAVAVASHCFHLLCKIISYYGIIKNNVIEKTASKNKIA